MPEAAMNTVRPGQSLGKNKGWLIFILGLLASFGPLTTDMYLPAFPGISQQLETNAAMVQLSLSANLLGLALGQLLAGTISDIKGRRGPLLIGLAVYAVTSLICACSVTIEMLVAARFVQGIAGASGVVIARAAVRDLFDGVELTKFFALLSLIFGSAPILAPIIGGQLLQWMTWRGIFMFLAAIGMVMFLAVMFRLPETLPFERRADGGIGKTLATFRTLFKDRIFIGYVLTQGLVFAALFSYIAGSPFVLQDIFGLSPQMFSLFFGINGLGIVFGNRIVGRLAGRVDEAKLLTYGLLQAAFSGFMLFMFLLWGRGIFAVMAALFLLVLSAGIVMAASFSLAMQNQANNAGSAAALLGLTPLLFGGVVSPAVGIGGGESGLPMGTVIFLATLAALLCFVLLVRRKPEHSDGG